MVKRSLESLSSSRIFAYTAAFVLLMAGLLIGILNEQSYRERQLRDMSVQAKTLAEGVAAALMFNDNVVAQESASALSVNPGIAAVGIYAADGRLLASYSQTKSSAPPPTLIATSSAAYRGAFVEAVAPVARDGQSYGAVFIRAAKEKTIVRIGRYAPVVLLVVMAALVLGVAGAAQIALQKANAELAARADALARANQKLEDEIAQRKKAEEDLLQSRKMEAIGQLTGGVAHDFNNLLMVISGGLRMLQRDGASPERQRKVTEAMHQAVERGAGLTRQLLAFARRQPLELRAIYVGRQIEGMKELLERSLRADILFETDLPTDLPPIQTDTTQFELAILNLCVNARDAMPKGGLLRISARRAAHKPDDYVEIVVSDTGTGIPPDVVERIFEPYFTTKQLGQGTGLGLSQVYGFVQQNGGSIRIDTALNRGTSMILSLPVSEVAVEAPAREIAPQHATTSHEILVVEDDEQVASTVVAMLEELNHKPTLVPSADRALETLASGRQFDLLFSDIVMPGQKNGLDLAAEAESKYPELPILLTTGYSGGADINPRWPVLRKPYDVRRLAEAVAAHAHHAGKASSSS